MPSFTKTAIWLTLGTVPFAVSLRLRVSEEWNMVDQSSLYLRKLASWPAALSFALPGALIAAAIRSGGREQGVSIISLDVLALPAAFFIGAVALLLLARLAGAKPLPGTQSLKSLRDLKDQPPAPTG